MLILAMPASPKSTSSPDSATFGIRLAKLRRARGLTQIQFAQAIGIGQSVVSYYEVRAEAPAGPLLMRMAQTLGVTADELLGAAPLPKSATAPARQPSAVPAGLDPAVRRYWWPRIQRLMALPEKDKRAVLRMLDTMTKNAGSKENSA